MINQLYFAYGSNLCLPRMRHRVPGVREVGRGRLHDHVLRWHKRGSDGSGKCSIQEAGAGEVVYGALLRVPATERPELDRIEGLGVGYRRAEVDVHRRGSRIRAWTYVAADAHVDDALRPFGWYRALVLAGATALGFPSDYLAAIRTVTTIEDPDIRRAARHRRFLSVGHP